MRVVYESLNEKDHGSLRVAAPVLSSELARRTHAPIVRSELFMAASCFPVFIMRDDEHDQFVPVVQFCLEAGQNLFVGNGQWNSPYLPLDIRRRPFAVAPSGDDSNTDSYDVLINIESDLITKDGGHSLYEAGEETVFLKLQKEILTAFLAGQEATQNFMIALSEAELLTPVEVLLSTDEGPRRVTGLYGIHHGKFGDLSLTRIGELQERGLLQDCYFMLASYAQTQRLIWMENAVSTRKIQAFSIKPAP